MTIISSTATADALSTAFSLMMKESQIGSLLPYVSIERVHLIDATGVVADFVA